MARNALAVRIPLVSGRFFSSLMLLTAAGPKPSGRLWKWRSTGAALLRVLKKRVQLKLGQSRGAGHPDARGHGRTAGQSGGGRSRRNVVFCR